MCLASTDLRDPATLQRLLRIADAQLVKQWSTPLPQNESVRLAWLVMNSGGVRLPREVTP